MSISPTHGSVSSNRDNDLRSGFERAGEIARVGVNIVHNYRIVLRDWRAADSLAYRNANVLGRSAAKRPENKHLRVIGIEHVEARPVVIRQALRDDLDNEVL